MSNMTFDWMTWATRQGVFAAMLIAGAIWFASAIVTPMRDSQTRFMEAVIKSNDLNADTNRQNTVTNASNSALLTKVIDNQSTIISTQKATADTQSKILEVAKDEAAKRAEYLRLLEQIRDKK